MMRGIAGNGLTYFVGCSLLFSSSLSSRLRMLALSEAIPQVLKCPRF